MGRTRRNSWGGVANPVGDVVSDRNVEWGIRRLSKSLCLDHESNPHLCGLGWRLRDCMDATSAQTETELGIHFVRHFLR